MAGSQNRIEFTVAAKADTASFKALQDQLSNVGIAVERAAKKNGGMTKELKNAKFDAAKLEFSKIPENSSLKEISKNLEHYQGIKQ